MIIRKIIPGVIHLSGFNLFVAYVRFTRKVIIIVIISKNHDSNAIVNGTK